MIVALNSDNSHQIRQYPHGGLRTMDFCFDRQFLRSGRLYIDCMAGPPTEETGGFDRDLCVCQRISDGLMFDDGINAAAPFGAREGERELKRRPHQRHRKIPTRAAAPVKQAATRAKPPPTLPKILSLETLTPLRLNCGKRCARCPTESIARS